MTRVRLTLIALALLSTACTPVTDAVSPKPNAADIIGIADWPLLRMPASMELEFAAATNGLLYTSESDYPFAYFHRTGITQSAAAPLSAVEFRTLMGIPAGTPVEVITLDTFFARHIER